MAYAKTSVRKEKRDLREKMRGLGLGYRDIAAELARCYRLRPRAAWREAYGWSLQETANQINAFRGEVGLDPGGFAGMTASHLCEHENWPGHGPQPSGRRPTPYLLAVLAAVYDCAVTDLIDLADRERLPAADLLILDKYSKGSPLAASRQFAVGPASKAPGSPPQGKQPVGLQVQQHDGLPDARLPWGGSSVRDSAGMVMAPDGTPDLLQQVELLRRRLDDTLSEGSMAEASLDDWERTVFRYGQASRHRPAGALLVDLGGDLAELKSALQRYRSASASRALTRVAAQMGGLMCLTFCKLDDRPAFRRWARTARMAADEAGDPETYSWVLAQEGHGHYYSGDLPEAVHVAQHAQAMARMAPCAGVALAAGLEARAQAAMGRHQETRAALARAEDITAQLDGDAVIPSAFGYNEAQLRFHAGSAYTSLRDAKRALDAQDRALALCMPGDYTDWAMTRLDRVMCLTYRGAVTDAFAYAIETMQSLSEAQRQGIITMRAYEILDALPKGQRESLAARDFRELLMESAERKGVPGQ